MKFGFIKVAAAIPQVQVADCAFNAEQIKNLILQASKSGVEAVVFPELSITGYTCGDLFYQSVLLDAAEDALATLLKETAATACLSAIGMPVRVGNALYNCAIVFQKGKILGVVPKSFLPNYGEFAEKRWFVSAEESTAEEIVLAGQEVPFGTDLLFACKDAVLAVELGADLSAPISLSSWASVAGANVILNLSAYSETVGKEEYLKRLVSDQSVHCCCGYVCASAGIGESSTDSVFSGNACIAENGQVLASAKRFELQEQLIISEIDVEKMQCLRRENTVFGRHVFSNEYRTISFELPTSDSFALLRHISPYPFLVQKDQEKQCEDILSIQAYGLLQRLRHTRCQKVILGISGGLDSTLALLVVVKAFDKLGLDRKGIIGVTMPCFGTTDRTYQNSLKLMNALKITSKEINIKQSCLQHLQDIEHPLSARDVTYENVQARERTQVLMDLANQQNALVIGTGDLSELALGWATYNGDHMSMYGVNSGVAKTLVRHLVAYVAQTSQDKDLSSVLREVLDTPVSPELLPPSGQKISQKTEDLVGPYELHDFYLYHFVRFGFSAKKIFCLAQHAFGNKYKDAEIKKWLSIFFKRFFAQQFKRSCLPDGPKVGPVSLSPRGEWHMPSDAKVSLWLQECEEL